MLVLENWRQDSFFDTFISVRTICSSIKIMLVVPKIALDRYGKRILKNGVAILWDSIVYEPSIRSEDIYKGPYLDLVCTVYTPKQFLT